MLIEQRIAACCRSAAYSGWLLGLALAFTLLRLNPRH
jgi:hypothetical protein